MEFIFCTWSLFSCNVDFIYIGVSGEISSTPFPQVEVNLRYLCQSFATESGIDTETEREKEGLPESVFFGGDLRGVERLGEIARKYFSRNSLLRLGYKIKRLKERRGGNKSRKRDLNPSGQSRTEVSGPREDD